MSVHKSVFYLLILTVLSTAILFSTATASNAELEQCGELDPSYRPDPAAIETLQQVEQPTEIVVFYGAWCTDSHREIPRFLKIIETVDNQDITVTDYGVNRQKQDELGKFEIYGIEFVPTFIVIRNGIELGRIIERPDKSLAKDLAAIMSSEN
jgi:thiol-disulfide isomerase/thioredoxin